MKSGIVLYRLYERLLNTAKDRRIADLRIGLSYVCVKLDHGRAGLAAVLQESTSSRCGALKEAGTFVGCKASEILTYLTDGQNALYRAVGLATANALVEPRVEEPANHREATSYFNFQAGDQVAMVGLFSPLVERIRATGARLTVIEKNPARMGLLSAEDTRKTLRECDIAIITATTLLNHTFEETVGMLGNPRIAAMIGPSTPLVSEIFQDTPLTHLGGVDVADADRILQITSEGGGTPAMRPYLRFVNVAVHQVLSSSSRVFADSEASDRSLRRHD
jgi:uncharacterized protein (DUF4213/DUF364 family)